MGTRRDVLKIVGASAVGSVTFDSRLARWASIPLRLIVGYGFAKLARGPDAFANILHGFSSIKLLSVTAAGAQFGPPGYELNLLYLAGLAALVLGGSGPLAIDGLLGKRRSASRSPTPWASAGTMRR